MLINKQYKTITIIYSQYSQCTKKGGDLGLRLLLQLLGKRKELDPSQLLITSEGCCCWEQGPLLLLTDMEELAGLAQPDKKEVEISGC